MITIRFVVWHLVSGWDKEGKGEEQGEGKVR